MATKKTKTVTETTTSAAFSTADDSVKVMEKTKENIEKIDVSTLHDSDEIEEKYKKAIKIIEIVEIIKAKKIFFDFIKLFQSLPLQDGFLYQNVQCIERTI